MNDKGLTSKIDASMIPDDSVLRVQSVIIRDENFGGGKIPTCVPRSAGIVVRLTRGGRGTGMGRGPR